MHDTALPPDSASTTSVAWPQALLDATQQAMQLAYGQPIRLERVASIDSTNSELMRRARAGCCEPVLLVAQTQTAGRGRLGRSWHGGTDDALTFSISLPLAPRDWSGLSLALGVALADALDPQRRQGLGLKWPNDLWFEARKLAGILVETVAPAGSAAAHRTAMRQLVIGVGINIAERPGAGLATAPAWARELMPGCTPARVLREVAAPLLGAAVQFEQYGFAPFHARFDARDVLRDRAVTATGAQGEATAGTAHGVSDAGALLLHTERGMQPIHALDVSVRPVRS
ncbi:MAG: biotin--[acetyl-CoA-carboxylase] ligase [Burkholderiales bacterium]